MPIRTDKTAAYQEAKDYLKELAIKIDSFEPTEKERIKRLCKVVLGPEMTASMAESSTEPMATMSRSHSNENLTETAVIQTGIKSALEILTCAAKNATPEDRRLLRKGLKAMAKEFKDESTKLRREPYFELLVSETDFSSLKQVEGFLPDHLSQRIDKIVALTADIAKCTVNVRNGKETDLGSNYLTEAYPQVLIATQQFLTEIADFEKELIKVSQAAIQSTEVALKKIEEKQQQLIKFSSPLAIERANLDVQKSAGRKLSMHERLRLLGYQSEKYPSLKGPTNSIDSQSLQIHELNLTGHFNALQADLSSCDELLKGPQRKQMGHLLADRHLINEELGEIRGLQDKFTETEKKYPEAQSALQDLYNDLGTYIEPLKAFKNDVQNSLSNRTKELNLKRDTILNTFKDLHQAAMILKISLPGSAIEIKSL